jgi:hypothetical protein
MNEQDKLPEWIDRYNNNRLSGWELEKFLELMKKNPELRREVKLDAELNDILADSEIIELRKKIVKYKIPKETNPRLMPLLFLAASVTILITLAIFAFLWIQKDSRSMMKTEYESDTYNTSRYRPRQLTDSEQLLLDQAAFDSISKFKDEKIKQDEKTLLSENYIPYPQYESMVDEVMRANGFKLITPSLSDTFRKGDIITFKWLALPSLSLSVTITDNKGQILFNSKPLGENRFLFNTSKLSGGLYYVKFINNEEIVYFSKFTLK